MNRHHRRAARRHRPSPAAIGFAPAATLVLSNDGLTAEQAMAPGRVSVMVPVPAGNPPPTPTPMAEAVLEAGGAVLLAFEDAADARRFQARLDTTRTTPTPTHPAPLGMQ